MKRMLRVSGVAAVLLALSLLVPSVAMAAPVAPSNLTAAIGGPRQVNLTWLDNSTDEKEFQVDRANDAAFGAGLRSFKANGVAGTGSMVSFNDNSVVAGQTFFYRVLAVDNAKAASAPSNVVRVDFVVPVGPTNLAAVVVSPTRVDLTWVDNAINETSYDVDRDTQVSFATRVSFEFQPANSTSFTDTTVQPNTTYFYRVQAVNPVGDSPLSNVVTVTTPAVPTTPPTAPTNLVASAASATQVSLTWTDTSNTETGFRIERSSAGAAFTAVGTTAANVATFNDSTVAGSTTYTFRVIAVNAIGDSAPAVAAPVTTPAPAPTSASAPAPAPSPSPSPAPAPAPAPVSGGGGGSTAPAPSAPSDSGASGGTAAEAPAPTPAPATETPTAQTPAPAPATQTPAQSPAPATQAPPSAPAPVPAPSASPAPAPVTAPVPSPVPPAAQAPAPASQPASGGINWLVVGSILAAVVVIGGIVLVSLRRSKAS